MAVSSKKQIPGQLAGFMDFIREQGVVGLAVGFILGGAVSKLVASLVNDIINPILGLALGAVGDLADASIRLAGAEIMWGSFVSVLIDFVVISLVVFYGVKALKLDRIDKKK